MDQKDWGLPQAAGASSPGRAKTPCAARGFAVWRPWCGVVARLWSRLPDLLPQACFGVLPLCDVHPTAGSRPDGLHATRAAEIG